MNVQVKRLWVRLNKKDDSLVRVLRNDIQAQHINKYCKKTYAIPLADMCKPKNRVEIRV